MKTQTPEKIVSFFHLFNSVLFLSIRKTFIFRIVIILSQKKMLFYILAKSNLLFFTQKKLLLLLNCLVCLPPITILMS